MAINPDNIPATAYPDIESQEVRMRARHALMASVLASSLALAAAPANAGPALPAALFVVSLPPTAPAGVANPFTVTAQDAFGNVATTYLGVVRFSSSDFLASLPTDYAFAPGDNGVHIFSLTLFTLGTQTLTATDTTTSSITGLGSTLVQSPVPEPAPAGILALALGLLAWIARVPRWHPPFIGRKSFVTYQQLRGAMVHFDVGLCRRVCANRSHYLLEAKAHKMFVCQSVECS